VYRQNLAATHHGRGTHLMAQGKRDATEAAYRDALRIQEQVVADFPKMPVYRMTLAKSYNNLGSIRCESGRILKNY
jgi:predicted Zn-dependent protease